MARLLQQANKVMLLGYWLKAHLFPGFIISSTVIADLEQRLECEEWAAAAKTACADDVWAHWFANGNIVDAFLYPIYIFRPLTRLHGYIEKSSLFFSELSERGTAMSYIHSHVDCLQPRRTLVVFVHASID